MVCSAWPRSFFIRPLVLLYMYGVGSSASSGAPDHILRNPSTRLEPDVSAESGCCGPQGLVCDGANFSGVVEETLYFAHPRSTGGSFDWGNHDMADSLGEAVSCARTQLFAACSASAVRCRCVKTLLHRWSKSLLRQPQAGMPG